MTNSTVTWKYVACCSSREDKVNVVKLLLKSTQPISKKKNEYQTQSAGTILNFCLETFFFVVFLIRLRRRISNGSINRCARVCVCVQTGCEKGNVIKEAEGS